MKRVLRKMVPDSLIGVYHYLLALIACVLHGNPSREMKVLGVTGTGGKSTVVNMTSKILEEAGKKVASSSSLVFKIGENEEENKMKMTMPGRFVLQNFLSKAAKADCDYAILEVTSEGIKQHRHRFIDFDMAAITNLNPEHIEAHKGFDNYKREKGKLFKEARELHVVNLDDEHADYFLTFPAKKVMTYGIENKNADVVAEDIEVTPNGSKFKIDGVEFELGLLCEFNVYNALCAITIGLSQGVTLVQCSDAIKKVGQISGRIEKVITDPFDVFVDYAFTPVALEKVYKFLKPGNSKLICVLGACGGGRDAWKRPVLGEIADKYGDYIIVTNEDPYDEDPQQIIDQVSAGVKNLSKLFKIYDRREGIRKALELAKPGDVVVITGKGCEPWICWEAGRKEAWSDSDVLIEEFEKISAR
ncbi:MAG: UDP-N-acetylmuramoyl-L-alanyl-D-glutamate--2,6-diaminopimelate ligase [Minisyncoccus archaeiphilus]|uniref:Mur ligase family protein n=1 Tax=Minisyncoccus archaeiphilus TaxID=3238481 RepID=UPI002B0E2FE5|nr:MAG: UDP-N-acetylmuramoyl-L-alanyl-D-glutamate--2,6-diaminopimelate ligase [Candidatus Parcubacteria bacterium]